MIYWSTEVRVKIWLQENAVGIDCLLLPNIL